MQGLARKQGKSGQRREGREVIMEAATALREQPEIRELFEVLEGNGLKKERQEVETLVNYLEGMESQFGQVIEELKEVRGQLAEIQDKGIKATAARLLDSAEGRVQEIGGQISLARTNLVRSAKNAVQEFKEKGVDALRKAVSAMKIPSALSHLKEGLHSGMEGMNRNAAKIGIVGGELNKAAQHTKNAGRALIGRQIKESAGQKGDKGVLDGIQKAFLSFGRSFASMEKATENVQKRMEQFCRGEEKKPSVKAELKRIKSGKTAGQKVQPAKEQAR